MCTFFRVYVAVWVGKGTVVTRAIDDFVWEQTGGGVVYFGPTPFAFQVTASFYLHSMSGIVIRWAPGGMVDELAVRGGEVVPFGLFSVTYTSCVSSYGMIA